MKGPFPDVNVLCLAGMGSGAFPGAAHRGLSPACSSTDLTSTSPSAPEQLPGELQLPGRAGGSSHGAGCSNSLAVASPPGTLIGHNMVQRGRKTLWGARGGPAMGRERLSGQMVGSSSDTQSATVCSSQRRSRVLSRAALGHVCLGTGLCDTSYSPGTQKPSCYLLVVHCMEERNKLGLKLLLLQQRKRGCATAASLTRAVGGVKSCHRKEEQSGRFLLPHLCLSISQQHCLVY